MQKNLLQAWFTYQPGIILTYVICTFAILVIILPRQSMSESSSAFPDKPLMTEKNLPYSIGRFNFLLPESWRQTGRQQHFYTLKVWNENFEPNLGSKELWDSHISFFKKNAANVQANAFLREVTLQGGMLGVWCRASPLYSDNLLLFSMKPQRDHVLFLEADVSAGRESIAEEVVVEIANTYVPSSPNGFSIEQGAFVIKPSSNEHVSITFNNGNDLEIAIQTDTLAEAYGDMPESEYQELALMLSRSNERLTILSKKERVVADQSGLERLIQLDGKDNNKELIYKWIFPGIPGNGLSPRIEIKGTAPLEQRDVLDKAWEQLLASIKRRNP